jgi:rubredoxin
VTTFKLREDINELQAKEPEHFIFIPTQFRGSDDGQWAVELEIERHNNLSKFSNVVDTWMLPHRRSVVRAFTRNLARVSKDHRLVLLPATDSFPFRTESIRKTFSYELLLPEDQGVFRWLILKDPYLLKEDLRTSLNLISYKDMAISDKGQNLRGVISMFEHLSQASEFLTNQYWRGVLRSWKDKPDSDKVLTMSQLEGFLPNSRDLKEKLKTELRFSNIRYVTKYLKANLTDTLEFLIRKKVFFRVHQWRCSYCGHANTRTFEDINETNNCSICSKTHFTPIDIEWKYELNNFIFRSLYEHNGLTVLWALGHLHETESLVHSFYYLPEVDLYHEYNNLETSNEIDLLCVIGGRFYAVEVKLSAIGFTEKPDEINKFIGEIKLIRPDVALLVFEQYCELEKDVESTKVELRKVAEHISGSVGKHIKVETLVASDFVEFVNHPINLGYWGNRVSKLVDSIKPG